MGKVVAVWISDTVKGDVVSDVISHAVPTSCIHVPTNDARLAIQRDRKNGLESGLHADPIVFLCGSTPMQSLLPLIYQARQVCNHYTYLPDVFSSLRRIGFSILCVVRSHFTFCDQILGGETFSVLLIFFEVVG